ncbi:hypothetical protein [Thermogemmatispora aurantia]|nr:hypothetical protein [Thermogemmatispora aurantia]
MSLPGQPVSQPATSRRASELAQTCRLAIRASLLPPDPTGHLPA